MSRSLKLLGYMAVAIALFGCGPATGVWSASNPRTIEPQVAKAGDVSTALGDRPAVDLAPGSRLAILARRLDEVAISRSSSVQDLRAAEALSRARRFDRYPQITPTASVPITGGGSSSMGIALEQTIWDSGHIKARLNQADLRVVEVSLRLWSERNKTVYEGLSAFVQMSRYQARLNDLDMLHADLVRLSKVLGARATGGVADGGELLRVTVALQQLQRDIVADEGNLRQARADLLRLLPPGADAPALEDLSQASTQCHRSWLDALAPADALAQLKVDQATTSEDSIRAQRFPRLVLAAGGVISGVGFSTPTLGLQLDASEMLGLGRGGDLEAAEASTQAAKASYRLQQDETRADLARLAVDYEGYRKDLEQLLSLKDKNNETLLLYQEQVKAGSIPITEGITLYQDSSDTRLSIFDLRAKILLNCLRTAQLHGALVELDFEALKAEIGNG